MPVLSVFSRSQFWGRLGALALFMGLAAGPSGPAAAAELLLKKESIYNTIYVFQDGRYRTLKFGHKSRRYIESMYNPKDPTELPVIYTRYITAGLAYVRKPEKALMIGMGGGRTSWYLAHFVPDLTVTAVELDPAIVKIADEYFGVRETDNLKIVKRDGRIFVNQSKEQYDFIMVDAYRGAFVPFHLLTKEFYELIEQRLTPDGVVVQNIEPSTMLFDHAIATIGSVFDTVDVYRPRGTSNIVVIAHDGPRQDEQALLARARPLQAQYQLRYDLVDLIEDRGRVMPKIDPDKVLTDDFAPANYLKSIEAHNAKLEESR